MACLAVAALFWGCKETDGIIDPDDDDDDDPANGIYVSPSGNDAAATGAIDAPYKSINAALLNAAAGSTTALNGYTEAEFWLVLIPVPTGLTLS